MLLYIMLCGTMMAIMSVIIIYMFVIMSQENKYTKTLARLLLSGMAATVSYGVFLLTKEYYAAFIASTIYIVATNWLIYFMLEYTLILAEVREKRARLRRIVLIVMLIDTGSSILNLKTQHLFYLMPAAENIHGWKNFQGVRSMNMIPTAVFSYMVVMITIVILVKKWMNSPSVYKKKYVSVLSAFLLAILTNVLCMILQAKIDYSIIFYSGVAVFICYATLEVFPKHLITNLNNQLVMNYNVAVLCFDIVGKCLEANRQACNMFGFKEEDSFQVIEEYVQNIRCGFPTESEETQTWEGVFSFGGRNLYVHFYFQYIRDKKGRKVGFYLLMEDRTEERRLRIKERYQSTHDELTGLLNRTGFFEEAQLVLDENKEEDFCLVTTNVKEFKLINNLFGTDVGDEALIKISELVRDIAGETGFCGRLSGDRFALWLPKDRFRESDLKNLPVTVSTLFSKQNYKVEMVFGAYFISDKTEPVHNMYNKANMALQSAKEGYSGHVIYYDEELMERLVNERKLVNAFDEAVDQEQFCIFLQPQVDENGKTVGGEALVRWNHPERGILPAGFFIPVYEKTGYIHKLDLYVWEQAAKVLKKWKDQNKNDLYISVNISVIDFYYLDIYREFTRLVEKYDISPEKLKLEITETVMGIDKDSTVEILKRLRDFGFSVEIDDFGSGYSSLNRLKDIPADVLKIDMLFLSETENENKRKAITETIIFLGKKLGMTIITEGVETKEQFEELLEAGCPYYQGYYFSKPIPVEQFEDRFL